MPIRTSSAAARSSASPSCGARLRPLAHRARRADLGARRLGAGPGAAHLRDLQARVGTAFLFISHDVAVIRYMCSRVLRYVSRRNCRGRAGRSASSRRPTHPYTQRAARGRAAADGRRLKGGLVLKGELTRASAAFTGCPFARAVRLRRSAASCRPPSVELGERSSRQLLAPAITVQLRTARTAARPMTLDRRNLLRRSMEFPDQLLVGAIDSHVHAGTGAEL